MLDVIFDDTKHFVGFDIRGGWLLAIVLIAAVVAVAIYLYRSEDRLSPQRRTVMPRGRSSFSS